MIARESENNVTSAPQGSCHLIELYIYNNMELWFLLINKNMEL